MLHIRRPYLTAINQITSCATCKCQWKLKTHCGIIGSLPGLNGVVSVVWYIFTVALHRFSHAVSVSWCLSCIVVSGYRKVRGLTSRGECQIERWLRWNEWLVKMVNRCRSADWSMLSRRYVYLESRLNFFCRFFVSTIVVINVYKRFLFFYKKNAFFNVFYFSNVFFYF